MRRWWWSWGFEADKPHRNNPFGLSLSKPAMTLRQAQAEREFSVFHTTQTSLRYLRPNGFHLCSMQRKRGFDRLSPNGNGCVFWVFDFPIILSLSKDRIRANGISFVFPSEINEPSTPALHSTRNPGTAVTNFAPHSRT